MTKPDKSAWLEKLNNDIEKQSINSRRPGYFPNETLGSESFDMFDAIEGDQLEIFLRDCLFCGSYYYKMFPEVSLRLGVSDGINFIDKPYFNTLSAKMEQEGGYIRTQKVHLQWWICNLDGANNATKPSQLVFLESLLKNQVAATTICRK